MLVEIQSDDFKTQGEPIIFREGLNTIFGTGNDVGKSTFLTVLGFVFGENRYSNLADIKARFKYSQHKINFTFKFYDGEHKFTREFWNSGVVSVCKGTYAEVERTISIDDYRQFLFDHYKMDVFGAPFHKIVGRYIRIMAKGNIIGNNPLKASANETKDTSMSALLKLFGFYRNQEEYEEVQTLKSDETQKRDMYKFYEQAQKMGVPEFSSDFTLTPIEHYANQQRIQQLENDIARLTKGEFSPEELFSSTEARQMIDTLETEREKIERRKVYYESKLARNDEYLGIKSGAITDDFDELRTFFPNAELHLIGEIQGFHRKLQTILCDEFANARSYYLSAINSAERDIADFNSRIAHIAEENEIPNVSARIARRTSEISIELERLRRINDGYDKAQNSGEVHRAAESRLVERTSEQLGVIESAINTEMSRILAEMSDSPLNAPRLKIKGISDYQFATGRGTGTALRGLVLFDLCVLHTRCLPILVHDSQVFDSISPKPFATITEAYRNCPSGKQIFIAVDEKGDYRKLLEDTIRLELSEDNGALYGEQFDSIPPQLSFELDDPADEE
ncbi:hypothetical protein FACS1894217_12330 [Clostridia bacterium]|nr:hypothetical protein FACS1894217_12330 [Clostridia bacterium]